VVPRRPCRSLPCCGGSLSLRKSPCIREKLRRLRSGEGHSSHVLYGRRDGKRFSIYIPDQMVPEVREAIANGRLIQELVTEAGIRYMEALKSKAERYLAGEKTAGRGYGMLSEQDFGGLGQPGQPFR